MDENIMTVPELASYLNISKWLAYDLVRKNKIPNFKVGGRVLFRKSTIDNWIAEQEKVS